jgi:sugar lactone lactonase YvrE
MHLLNLSFSASFNPPRGITTDGINLYVADSDNNKIRKIIISSGVITTLAGTCAMGRTNSVGTVAQFDTPSGITSDGVNLYIADTYNCDIRKIQ